MNLPQLPSSAYETAEKMLMGNRAKLMSGDKVAPRWIDGGARFWYQSGDKFLLVDPAAGAKEQVDGPVGDQSANFLEITSPDGRYAVYRVEHDLWVREKDQTRALTTDGKPDYGYGTGPDCMNYSILLGKVGVPHLPPSVSWSPDSTRILTHRTDQRDVRLTHVDTPLPADGGDPRTRPQRYAYCGDEHLPTGELIVFDVATGAATPARTDPILMSLFSPLFVGWAWWTPDSTAIYYLSQPRDQRTLTLNRLDPATGEVTAVITETGPTRVEPTQFMAAPPMVATLTTGDILWYSQRDDWGHLYRYDHTGKPLGQVTTGEWAVRQILHVDETAGVIYFQAAGLIAADPYRRSVCRVGLDGTGFARITGDDLDHAVTVAPNGRYFIDSASATDTPPVITARDWTGRVLVELERADISGLLATGWTAPERFRVKAADGETDIYGLLYRPHDFDPAQRYPVVDTPYPGPQTNRITPAFDPEFHGYTAEALAALGFAVLAVDGRGTPGRGKSFHDASYGRIEDAGSLDDHVAALRQLAETRPWLDLDRVGATGLSAGGYASMRALLDHPDVYKVGVSACGTHEPRLYHAGCIEAYAGTDPAAWQRASNVDIAERLAGKLLLIHGGSDDNVHADHTLRLVERLAAADKDFELLIVPGAEHLFLGYDHVVNRRVWDFLVRHLMGSEPPEHRLTPMPLDAALFAQLFG